MAQTAPTIMGADPIGFLRYRIMSLLASTPPARGRRFGLLLLAPLVPALAIGSVAIQHRGA